MIRRVNHGEKGAALIVVLLLVAIMSALIAVSFDRVGLAIRRERNRSVTDEARFDLISGEAVAVQRLTQSQSSGAADVTAALGRSITLPTPTGQISALLEDGGNCFNVNSLVSALPDGRLIAQPIAIAQLSRLIEYSGEPTDAAVAIAQSISDWIDSDSIPLPGGHEDEAYLRLDQPFRTANDLVTDVNDLRHVIGMDPALFTRIVPLLCALPETGLSAYNVNSIRLSQAALVAAVMPRGVTPQMVVQALRNRPAAGFASYQDLLTQPSLRDFLPPGEVDSQLRTKTVWFKLNMMAVTSDIETSETAFIDARLLPARVIQRSYGAQ